MAAGGETAIAFAAWLSHPTKPKYLTTFEMKGHIGGHFDRRTIADCRAESPGTEQLDSFLIQVRTVGTIDAYGADSTISTDRTVEHHIYLLAPAPWFWLRHHLPEGSAKGSTNIPHNGIWRRGEKVRIERTFDLLLLPARAPCASRFAHK